MTLGKTLISANNKSQHLKSCPICSGLGDDSLVAISHIAIEKTYEKDEFLMQEGDVSTGFFLVLSGKVRVYKSSANGKEKVLLIAEKGTTFGEDALFGQCTFQETARAMTKATVLKIPRQHFLNILRQNPDLAFQVMESLCLWIRRLSSSVENVAFRSARDKAARYLLDLYSHNQSLTVGLPAKKKEIADQLGLAPETFSRALHEFSEQKIIEIKNKTVTFLDVQQLETILNL